MAEEEAKKKINFKKIALFGLGPIVLIGIGLGVGAFLFMPTQTPVEQVEELIEKKLQQAGQLPSAEGEEEAADLQVLQQGHFISLSQVCMDSPPKNG